MCFQLSFFCIEGVIQYLRNLRAMIYTPCHPWVELWWLGRWGWVGGDLTLKIISYQWGLSWKFITLGTTRISTLQSDDVISIFTFSQLFWCDTEMRSQPLKPWCRRVGPVTFLVFLTGHVWDPTTAVPRLRAVITDVDGTLMAFATSSRISQRNRKALLAAKEVGCEVMVATGRIPGPWYDALEAEMPEILGAGVYL